MASQQDELLLKHLNNRGVDQSMLMDHPASLFILFFTEMWERFSYYGMRALLTVFLVSELTSGGWEWTNEEALKLYGIYTGLVYLTPLLGGIIADKFTGYRKAILIGALIMTLGHALRIRFSWDFYVFWNVAIFLCTKDIWSYRARCQY